MLEYIKCATGPDLWIFWEKPFISKYQKVWQVRTCGITWKIARIYKICHRSGPCEYFEKKLIFKYQKCDRSGPVELCEKMLGIYKMCHRSGPVNILRKKLLFLNIISTTGPGPVELCEKMLEYIKCATGPDLWIFWEKTFIFKYQKCHRSGPVELREKMLEYIKMCHRSGPCEYLEKKLLFLNIKSATGPDLWELREKMPEYIKCATGPDLWIFWEKTFISKYQMCRQVRTCRITWKNARIYKMCHRSGPVNILRKNFYF